MNEKKPFCSRTTCAQKSQSTLGLIHMINETGDHDAFDVMSEIIFASNTTHGVATGTWVKSITLSSLRRMAKHLF